MQLQRSPRTQTPASLDPRAAPATQAPGRASPHGVASAPDVFTPSARAVRSERLAEIDAAHPDLARDVQTAREAAEQAEARSEWSGLAWYEKATLLAFPFGGLILAGIVREHREEAQDKRRELSDLLALQQERAALVRAVPAPGGYA